MRELRERRDLVRERRDLGVGVVDLLGALTASTVGVPASPLVASDLAVEHRVALEMAGRVAVWKSDGGLHGVDHVAIDPPFSTTDLSNDLKRLHFCLLRPPWWPGHFAGFTGLRFAKPARTTRSV